MMFEVDVITAVHTPSRPVERAVRSVLEHTKSCVRVTVVVHNTPVEPIEARLGALLSDARLRIVTHVDGRNTPAGPKNHGLELATAPYVAMLDSDDTLEAGALDDWLLAARGISGGADVVIAPTTDSAGRLHPSPPARLRYVRASARGLDPVKDRLAYRASPLGLIRRSRFGDLRFAENVPTGEDQPVTAALWFTSGAQIVFPVDAGRYIEHHDQGDRVTGVSRSVHDEFISLDHTLSPSQHWSTHPSIRLSLAVKLIRVHLFDAARARSGADWTPVSAEQLATVAERILGWEPRAVNLLSRVDNALLKEIRAGGGDPARIAALLKERSHLRRPSTLTPKRLRFLFHSQAPLRFHIASMRLRKYSTRKSLVES